MLLPKTIHPLVGARRVQARRSFVIVLGVALWSGQAPSAAGIQTFTAALTGAQQVPAVSSSGTGSGTVQLNATEDQIVVNLSFSGLTTPAIAAHIHGPGAAGVNAAVLFDFTAVTPNATAGTIPEQTFAITAAQVADLKAGLYYFNIHTTNFSGGEIRGQIGLAGPAMSLDKTSLAFGAVNSGTAFTSQTSAQTVQLTQTGAGTVTWTAASTAPWLVVSPTSGSGSATLTISVQFAPGLGSTQSGNVTLTFTGAGNTAGPVAVTLTSRPSGGSTGPAGSFDTPTDGTTGVAGSIAVTGWALDDIEVTGVRILRDPVAGEPLSSLVFIGNAVLVDGARPDVQALFPTLPRASRAGWGYLMLTNFLPGLGNGTFRLYAVADDPDGHSTTLGTKVITCSNSTSTAPFGAIDTPAQGGTVSASVVNFGWVLSRTPYFADPPDGGTVRVVIDGAFLAAVPTGWTSRSDLSALFPASLYPGIGKALGVATFDSTALANGVHTISWLVTDNVGSASGIGSRYFTVSNGSLFFDPGSFRLPSTGLRPGKAETTGVEAREADPEVSWLPLPSRASWLPPLGGSLRGRRGFDPHAAYRTYPSGHDGHVTVQSEELDRIELQLDDAPGQTYRGYLRAGDGLAPLPIGSSLNPSSGAFTWMPGVGFIGTYDLVFVRQEAGRAIARQEVRIVLNPMRSNRVGPQTTIDLPAAAPAEVGRSFVLAGWAADLDSTFDRGVDTVHVWAYPASGGDPIWIGAAAYGGARPDVAAIHGDRFLQTGYGIRVQGLAPGTYDLAVFAYSTVRSGFVPARTVRVTVR